MDVRSQLPDAARKAWDAAKQLAGASDFRGALVEFQRAYELSHNARVLFNVGVTEKLLTHYARAVDAWDKEQSEGAGQLGPAELQELKNAIAIVQQFVTTIDVTANEADATLSIDDYPIGKTPVRRPGADRRRQARAQAVEGWLRRRRGAGGRRRRRQDAGQRSRSSR